MKKPVTRSSPLVATSGLSIAQPAQTVCPLPPTPYRQREVDLIPEMPGRATQSAVTSAQ